MYKDAFNININVCMIFGALKLATNVYMCWVYIASIAVAKKKKKKNNSDRPTLPYTEHVRANKYFFFLGLMES